MSWARYLHRDEAGVALITAMLAMVILTGLSLVFVGRSITETRVSAQSRDHETALHAAEAAADLVISELNAQQSATPFGGGEAPEPYRTLNESGAEIIREDTTDLGVLREWARDLLPEMDGTDEGVAPADTWVSSDSGEAYAVRPVDSGGDPVNEIFAVGASPSFDAERARTRILRLQVSQDHYQPPFALLTDSVFEMGGNSRVIVDGCDPSAPEDERAETCIADVHSNAGLNLSGHSDSIQGRVSTTTGDCGDASVPLMGCLDEDDGVAPRPIPRFTARDFYRPRAYDSDDESDADREWFDLCDTGMIRAGSDAGPCQGSLIWDGSGNGNTEYRGWSFKDGEWSADKDLVSGIYYVQGADVSMNQGDAEVSIFVESSQELGSGHDTSTGSLDIGGNATLRPYLDDVLFVADRDIELAGDAGAGCQDEVGDYGGFIGTGEQFAATGTSQVHGAIVEQDVEQHHDLVDDHKKNNGDLCLEYDADLVVDLSGFWVITYWNEL